MSQKKSRIKIINHIYKAELLGREINLVDAFEKDDLTEKETRQLEIIKTKYINIKALITNFLSKTWSWERTAPLERAILIFGTFEMSFRKKPIVINELIEITKDFIPGDNYKFINSILDKAGEHYERT